MADGDQDKDSKTEEATPRKREEAREKGQVAMSQEFVAALMLCAGLGALAMGGGRVVGGVGGLLARSLETVGERGQTHLDAYAAAGILESSLRPSAMTLLFLLVPVVGVGALVAYGQIGFQFTPKAVEFDLNKLNPLKGLQRMFSARSVMRLTLAVLKMAAIAVTMSLLAWRQMPSVLNLAGSELGPMLRGLGRVVMLCTLGAVIAVLAISLFDLLFQRWQHDRDLRMSKQEVKEERKNTEGDPHVKARIRSVQREMAQRRMMADVPKASVVITNPTHYAVALRYEREDGAGAPKVLAKGTDAVAQRIKEIARENDVPLHEDVPLARALHAQCEVGDEIPEDLYAAVATVLTHVYKLQGRTA